MEELFAYAYLCAVGFDVEQQYETHLNALFLAEPENAVLLELEILSGDIKETISYITRYIQYHAFHYEAFGRILIKMLKPLYQSTDIQMFGERMYALWQSLPGSLQMQKPFDILCYADDAISWGDEAQSRRLYETVLFDYDASEPAAHEKTVFPHGMDC